MPAVDHRFVQTNDVQFDCCLPPRENLFMSIQSLFENGNLPNIVLIITDQERKLQHWPSSFRRHLPAMTRLMKAGLTFENAFTGASMCSPSRATFLTSNYPAVTGVTVTGSPEPHNALPLETVFPNLATVLAKAGYQTIVWKGKWHLGGSTGPDAYGFSGWDQRDAGNYLFSPPSPPPKNAPVSFSSLGGGTPDNDGRYLTDILSFLSSVTQPFCLVASFVNPHDVFMGYGFPSEYGYPSTNFPFHPIPLPKNASQNPDTMPRAQAAQTWNPKLAVTQQNYLNFYAYLQTLVDGQILDILNQLNQSSLLDSTLIIRFADHGEMGISHGLVEKFYNAYEETIHIPLIFSNPVVWPAPAATNAMASLLDLVPTLASLLGVSTYFPGLKGQDLTPILENPSASVQESVHFTYDDETTTDGPSIVRTIRNAAFTYSVYFVEDGSDADWELYDLNADPLQNNNVAGTEPYAVAQTQLDQQLQQFMAAMGTAPSFTWPPTSTAHSRGGPPAPIVSPPLPPMGA